MVATSAVPSASTPKLGDILRDVLPELGGAPWLDGWRRTVLYRLARCGTDEGGLVKLECQECGSSEWRPMSCQDRHCPSCGAGRGEDWVQARLDGLLDVPYFHLSFGLPQQLHALCRDNPVELYGLLFTSVQQTLKAFAADSDELGGTPAFFSVLHTATRRLHYFPHIHVVMAGATFDERSDKLAVVADDQSLFCAEALAEAFADRFIAGLRDYARAGKLAFTWQATQVLDDPAAFEAFLVDLAQQNWSVWLEPTSHGVESTIRYLGRYIQRTAITNARIKKYDGTSVTYVYQDTRTRQRHTRTVDRHEFVRLFAQHILPKGFQRVRFYGLLAPSKRTPVLPRAQAKARETARLPDFTHAIQTGLQPERPPAPCCQQCGAQALRAIAILRRDRLIILHPPTYPTPPPGSPGHPRRKAS